MLDYPHQHINPDNLIILILEWKKEAPGICDMPYIMRQSMSVTGILYLMLIFQKKYQKVSITMLLCLMLQRNLCVSFSIYKRRVNYTHRKLFFF